ncbi:MAG: 5'-nucleotidase [Deltaproteobacteria bacterium]
MVLTDEVTEDHDVESAEGDLFCDLMLAAWPAAQIAVSNGGSLRAGLPAGELTYGALFRAMPFDNRFAIVDVTGAALRRLVTTNLQTATDILSWSGLTAKARCNGNTLDVEIMINGQKLDEGRTYELVTSDFLASGGQGVIGELKLSATAIHNTTVIVREAMAGVLRTWKGTSKATIDPTRILSVTHRRLDYVGSRPIECAETGSDASEP